VTSRGNLNPTESEQAPGCSARDPALFLMTDSLQVGGTERQFATLAKSLRNGRFQVSLGCLQRKGPFLHELGEISEFPLGGSFLSFQAQRSRLALARRLRHEHFAIAHSLDFYSNLMLIPTARLSGVPVVIGSQRQLGDLLTPWQSRLQGLAFRLCDRVVCNSHAAARLLTNQGLAENKVTVIPNGLPGSAFAEVPPSLPRSCNVLRIGLIARMNDRVKNHAGFLRVASQLSRKYPTTEFLLVGDGPLRPELESLATEVGLGSCVKFLGERRDIAGLLAAMDVSVVFSSSESLSNVALESMAAGVPIVATRVGGNPDIVREGETGLLVTPRDEEGLARALEQLMTCESLRVEMGRRGKNLAMSYFTVERVTKQYEQLYSSLLSEKKPRSHRSLPSHSIRVLPHRLRVAIVAASPRWIGGQGVQAETLMRSWQGDPVVDASFIPIDPDFVDCLRWAQHVPLVRTLVRIPHYVAALWRGTREAELIHIFSASYWSFLLAPLPAWLVARFRGSRTLINYHSGEAEDHLSRSKLAVRVLRAADRIVVPSQYLVEVFRQFNLSAEEVPNAVDLRQFAFRPRRPLKPRLVCTRGFHPYYNVGVAVRAFALVKEQYPGAQLCLLGGGREENQVRGVVKELKLNDVEFAGAVPHDIIHRFYEQNDIFINASWLDNAPVSILEAFASGTPVVTTTPKGIRYMVEHERTGLLCEPGDWKALGKHVLRLLKEQEFALFLAQNAYENLTRYTWSAVRKRWLDEYASTLSMRTGIGSLQPSSVPVSSVVEAGGVGAKPKCLDGFEKI